VRAVLAVALVLGLAVSAGADASLGRLADALAQEVARQARGRAVELAPTVDRTGRGARLVLDLDTLVRSRVGAAGRLAATGPRLQVFPVLAEAPGRLVVSARLVEQPGGALQDLVSLSIEADPALLDMAARPPAAAAGGVDFVRSSQSAPLAGHVLDLAFAGPDRLLVLGDDDLALYRWDDGALALLARRRLGGSRVAVRHPGGLLRAVEAEHAAWAATSRGDGALLFGVDDAGIVQRQQADVMPWPGSAAGLRFRPGTNLIEGALAGLGEGPFLRVDPSGRAVDGDGRLLPDGAHGDLRVGPTLAPLWPGYLAASSAAPPGARDTVLVLALGAAAGPRVVSELPVDGAVRALAARVSGQSARLIAAVEGDRGRGEGAQTWLVAFELAAPGP
jgi:hypothetical protein